MAIKDSIEEKKPAIPAASSDAPSLIQGQIAYLYKNKTLGFWSNIILSSILLFVLWLHLPKHYIPLLIWFGLIVTLSIVRFLMGKSFKSERQYTQIELTGWANRHVFFTTLISTIWGLAGLVFFPTDLPHQIVLVLILFSVLLASIPTLAASRIAYYFQVIVTLLPTTVLLFLSQDQGHGIMSGAIVVMAITLILISNYIYQLLFELQETQLKLQSLADTDQLTKLANRRHFDRKFKIEWRRAMREKTPISMLLIDVDFFKKYNDTYGHQAGDSCLKQLSDAMASVTHRPADLASRYGGEEFSILLPVTKQADAVMLAERLRRKIEGLQIEHSRTDIGVVTVSIGVSCCEPAWDFTGNTPDEEQKVIFPAMLLTAADNALYVSKERGRNQVSEQGCGDHKMAHAMRNQVKKETAAKE
ncbi:MAG: GGDEF domain-containing protein [Cocleimonas sp.]